MASTLLITLATVLTADPTSSLDLYAMAVTEFTVTLNVNTLSYYYTSADIAANTASRIPMGSFSVSIEDVANPTVGHSISVYSLYHSTSGAMQMRKVGTKPDLLQLFVEDNRASNGTFSPTPLINGSTVRVQPQGAPAALDENHIISVSAEVNSLTNQSEGTFENYLYFVVTEN